MLDSHYLGDSPVLVWPVLQCDNIFVLPGIPQFFQKKVKYDDSMCVCVCVCMRNWICIHMRIYTNMSCIYMSINVFVYEYTHMHLYTIIVLTLYLLLKVIMIYLTSLTINLMPNKYYRWS
jgi:hypothetical protein